MYNQKGVMHTQSIIFRIEMCNSEERNDCKPKEKIKKFARQLIMQLWVIDPSLDLSYFEG